MTDTDSINSESYWNARFTKDWEACDGPRQSRFFARIAIEHLPLWLMEELHRQSLTLVDWGCAQGDGADVWAGYIDATQIAGVDFSAAAIAQAARRYPAIRFINADWLADGDDQEIFDVVFSSNTLEHFNQPYDVLNSLCIHAKKALVLALPYKELERINEHFFSFLPENIPLQLANGFRLIWSRVVDCRLLPDTLWGGDQIILIYADTNWSDSLKLTLSDCHIAQNDMATEIAQLHIIQKERDGQIARLNQEVRERDERIASHDQAVNEQVVRFNQFVTERDNQIVSLNRAVGERDAQLVEMARIVDAYKYSRSWRITAPLRWLGAFVRQGGNALTLNSNAQPNSSMTLWRRRVRSMRSRYKQGVQRHGYLRSVPLAIRAFTTSFFSWVDKRIEHRSYEQKLKLLRNIITEHRGFIDLFHVPMGWDTPLFQRFQHMSLQAAQLGGLALYGGHLQVDKDLFVFRCAEGNVIVFDALDDQVVQCVFDAMKQVDYPKILRLQSIDLATRIDDVERFLNDGIKVVYEYIDEISEEITGSIPGFVIARHKWLLQDPRILVVATSDKLFSEVCMNREGGCILSTNGVDLGHWRQKVAHAPTDMEPAINAGRTVVGYHGALANWIDYELLRKIADSGNYELVLIGYEHDSSLAESKIVEHPHVHFLGSKSYFVLNQYAVFYDVGILPFKRYALTESVSPVKLFEYMAAEKPVVTTDLRECSKYESCLVSDSHELFLENLSIASTAKNDEKYQALLRRDAEQNSWGEKAAAVFRLAGVELKLGASMPDEII